MTRHLAELLEKLGTGPAHLAGYSRLKGKPLANARPCNAPTSLVESIWQLVVILLMLFVCVLAAMLPIQTPQQNGADLLPACLERVNTSCYLSDTTQQPNTARQTKTQ